MDRLYRARLWLLLLHRLRMAHGRLLLQHLVRLRVQDASLECLLDWRGGELAGADDVSQRRLDHLPINTILVKLAEIRRSVCIQISRHSLLLIFCLLWSLTAHLISKRLLLRHLLDFIILSAEIRIINLCQIKRALRILRRIT